jgi:uncharacterized membrane protein YraQ (UPF0718 family)
MLDLTAIVAGVLVRTGQALIEATPTVLCGIVVAGILRRMVGAPGVRRAFGAAGWRGVLRGWAFGMLLPVCSLGVIPVAREMRRCGVSDGTVLAFVLAAPLLNPISFLYGLTLSEPLVILVFALGSLVLALLLGELWNYRYPPEPVPEGAPQPGDEPLPAYGVKRLIAVAETTAREATGPVLLYSFVGVIASGLMAALLPFGSLQHSMKYADHTAPLQMAGIALPSFNSPLNGMMKLGLMFDHGNSVGAAFVLFVLGLGVNLGLVAWVCGTFGARRGASWFAVMVLAVVACGYVAQLVLPAPARLVDHTHAFDDYSNPFTSGSDVTAGVVWDKIKQKAEVLELASLPLLGGFVLLGLAFRWVRAKYDLEAWLTRQPEGARKVGKYDVVVPGPVLAVLALLGLVVFSAAGAYIYYPEPAESLKQIHALRADVASAVAGARNASTDRARKRAEAVRELEQLDLAVRKLMVGTYIRKFALTAEQKEAADELREAIEEVRDELLTGDPEKAYALMRAELTTSSAALRNAFSNGSEP